MQKLSKRLDAVASLVRKDARIVDVGCDHGYVPVALVLGGHIPSAIACDINPAPLNSCVNLVNKHSLSERITCVISDGLDRIDGSSVDDIIIAGMGGELIASVLDRCAYVSEKHLIINPMTHPELVRKWLYDHGWEIINDIIVSDCGHQYSVFDAEYTGVPRVSTEVDWFLGEINDFSEREYFIHLLNYLKNKEKGGADYARLIKIIEEKI